MKPFRASLQIGTGLLFAAATLYLSFAQPYIPGAVEAAIPPQSSFSFKATGLDELIQSPIRAQIDHALGGEKALEQLLEKNEWLKLAAPSEIAITDIPYRHPGQRKAWAAISWVGWRSPWLRWKLEGHRDPGLRFLGKHSVWPIWQIEHPALPEQMRCFSALTDNLFMICISEDINDILILLNAYDQTAPKR